MAEFLQEIADPERGLPPIRIIAIIPVAHQIRHVVKLRLRARTAARQRCPSPQIATASVPLSAFAAVTVTHRFALHAGVGRPIT
jgi:hypothetical protein